MVFPKTYVKHFDAGFLLPFLSNLDFDCSFFFPKFFSPTSKKRKPFLSFLFCNALLRFFRHFYRSFFKLHFAVGAQIFIPQEI